MKLRAAPEAPHRGAVHYFAYGSNLSQARLEARVGPVEVVAIGTAPDWRVRFDKAGRDGSGKANIGRRDAGDAAAPGVVYRLDAAQFEALHRFEGGYDVRAITVDTVLGRLECMTYVAPSGGEQAPYTWYLAHIVAGATEHGMDAEHVSELGRTPAMRDSDAARVARETPAFVHRKRP